MLASVLVTLGLAFPSLGATTTGCTYGARTPTTSSSTALRVRYLGVGGFLIERGSDAVLTAPLYTRPSWLEVSTGFIASNPALVDMNLPPAALANVSAVVSGHAHYDHLLDVPAVMSRAPRATLFANRSARNILAAYAPDRSPRCAMTPPPLRPIPRQRVVALDDPAQSFVDYSMCPSKRPPNAPIAGRWMGVPGAAVRIFALCSEHPDQLGPVHYAPGGVEDEQCVAPARAAEWLEGNTLAYLIDFLDPRSGAPVYRVYYQDAPTSAPFGFVPEPLLREKRIDIALLCVGAYERTMNSPTQVLGALQPRYAIGAHWEDFARPANEPPQPIPLLDLATWVARARMTMPRTNDHPMLQNGGAMAERFAVPRAGEWFEITP